MGFFRKYPKFHRSIPLSVHHSMWKVSKYGVFSGPYCPNLSGLSDLRITPYSARIRESADQKKFRICTHFTQCQKEHTISPWKAYKLEKPGVLRMMTIKHRYFDLEIFVVLSTARSLLRLPWRKWYFFSTYLISKWYQKLFIRTLC